MLCPDGSRHDPASQDAIFGAECLGFWEQGREAEEPPLTSWQDPWCSDKLVLIPGPGSSSLSEGWERPP